MTRIGLGYSSYTASAVSNLLSNTQPRSGSSRSNPNLTTERPSQNAVVNKIEKHIDDVRKGNGEVSKDVSYILSQQDSNANSILAQTSPRTLALYSGYLSGLRYDRAARFVNGVEYSLNSLKQVKGN